MTHVIIQCALGNAAGGVFCWILAQLLRDGRIRSEKFARDRARRVKTAAVFAGWQS